MTASLTPISKGSRQLWEALGVRVAIEAPASVWLRRLGQRLAPVWRPTCGRAAHRRYRIGAGPGQTVWSLQADGTPLGAASEQSTLLDLLQSELELLVATRAPRHVVVHAAVVGWHGQAIVLPGRSRSGKTTLTQALLKRGATYYSDECAVFDTEGQVHPYARPLVVRGSGGRRHRLPAGRLRAPVGIDPLSVGQIVVTHFREAAAWRPNLLSPAQAALELLSCCAAARCRPAAVLRTLSVATARATACKGVRGEADEVADRILSHDGMASQ